jgi:hypothetical protein
MLGYSALRFFRETAHLCGAREPMHRIITGHDADRVFSSAEHLGESRRIWRGHGVSVCCEYLFFPSRKSTLREGDPKGDLLIAAAIYSLDRRKQTMRPKSAPGCHFVAR